MDFPDFARHFLAKSGKSSVHRMAFSKESLENTLTWTCYLRPKARFHYKHFTACKKTLKSQTSHTELIFQTGIKSLMSLSNVLRVKN